MNNTTLKKCKVAFPLEADGLTLYSLPTFPVNINIRQTNKDKCEIHL